MIVYVSMIIWTAICGMMSKDSEQTCIIEGREEKRTNHLFAFLTMGYIVFFMGSLCSAFDMTMYEGIFNSIPAEPSEISSYMETVDKYPGFYLLQILFKTYVSTTFYHFSTLIVAFDCLALCYVFRKYSCNFALTVFIFIASGKVVWMVNGVKQFMAACIILSFSKFLMEKKFIPFAIGVLIASQFHTSALVVLPVYFFVHGKPWNKKMMLIMILSLLSITFLSTFSSILEFILESSEYGSQYADSITSGTGSSIFHFLIASVPAVIALICKKKVEETAPAYINICINMSIITACVFLLASFTSGILMGRMPVYFQMYSFIALPWLLKNCFEKETSKTMTIICVIFYLISYFLAFANTPYYSKALNIYISN